MIAEALLVQKTEEASGISVGQPSRAVDDPTSGCSNRAAEQEPHASTPNSAREGWEAPDEVREGEIIGGKYRIERLLGSGAMGQVFLAHHILLHQKVAIKVLVPEYLGHPDSVARFVREARATVTIKSDHVVRVHDVALSDGGRPYIVMEYLEGSDLAAWLRAHGPPDVCTAVDFVLQACDAIGEAHGLGIIHRDIKPANLFVLQRRGFADTIKVLDFGISKAPGLVSSTARPGQWRPGAIITEERVPIGSPCYMSPEQMESARDVDLGTDIWALGVTLCELVTGQLPFKGQSLVQVYATIKSGVRVRVPKTVPAPVETAIRKCLEPERERRYGTVRELQAALAPFRSGKVSVLVSGRPALDDKRPLESAVRSAAHTGDAHRPGTALMSADAAMPAKPQRVRATKILAIGVASPLLLAGLLVVAATSSTHVSSTHVSPVPLSTALLAPPSDRPVALSLRAMGNEITNTPQNDSNTNLAAANPAFTVPAPSRPRPSPADVPTAAPSNSPSSAPVRNAAPHAAALLPAAIQDAGSRAPNENREAPSPHPASSHDDHAEWQPPAFRR